MDSKYSVTETIIHNFDKSEVIHTIKETQKDKEIFTQISDIGNRYDTAVSFIQWYLEDVYKTYNYICIEIKNYSKLNKYQFPSDITLYSKDYIAKKIKDYKLELGKLEGY
jgi:hypothetical protein